MEEESCLQEFPVKAFTVMGNNDICLLDYLARFFKQKKVIVNALFPRREVPGVDALDFLVFKFIAKAKNRVDCGL